MLEAVGFRIEIRTSYIEVDAFYFTPGWEKYFQSQEDREFLDKCLTLSPLDGKGIEDVVEAIEERGCAVNECLAMYPNDALIEVDGSKIENPFSDHHQWELPSPESLLRKSIRSSFPALKMRTVQQNFLYFKVWENSGGFLYEGRDSFALEKLVYKDGLFLYDDHTFDLTDGDGSSSYEVVYRDGTCVTV
jgi:hypothetical protein